MNTEKRKNFLINFAYFAVMFLAAFVLFRYGMPLVTPFLVAFVIAYMLQKPIRILKEKVRLQGTFPAILLVLIFYAVAGALFTFLSVKVASGILSLLENLPHMYEIHVRPFFMDILFNVEGVLMGLDPALVGALDEVGNQVLQSMGDLVSRMSVAFVGTATEVATGVPGAFIKLVLMIISTFFITIDYDRLTGFCMRQLDDKAKDMFLQVKEYLVGTLWVCIRSYALIMSLTFVELSIGLTVIGIEHAVLVAFCIAVFDILPVLGTGGIMIPWTILTAIQGNYALALGLLAIYLIITVIRNILEPKIVGSQLGLHPVVTLCSMFAGAQLFGAVGLFGFPIGLSLLVHLDKHGAVKLFR